jgi:integrase
MRFDKTNVFKIKPPADKADYTEWDDGMPGFGIRFRNQGAGVYMIQYRVNGRTGKMTFGAVSKIALADAQKRAREAFNLIADGKDPTVEKVKTAAKMIRFKDKVDDYIAYLRKAGRTEKYIADNMRSLGGAFGTEDEVAGYFAGLHKITLPELNRGLIATELGAIEKEHGTGAMRNCRSHIVAYLTWCVMEGLIDVNPAEATRKPETVKRERVLAAEKEITPLLKFLMLDDGDFNTICRLLWLTMARRDEIAQLRKSEVDRKKRLIFLPGERTKNGLSHVIPLSTQAWALLEPKLDQRQGDFVFGSGRAGYSGWDKATNRMREAVALEHFTLHDFRRTGRSLAKERPVSVFPHILEAILNHIGSEASGKRGVAGVYDVHNPWQYYEEKAEGLQRWADYLTGLTTPKLRVVA